MTAAKPGASRPAPFIHFDETPNALFFGAKGAIVDVERALERVRNVESETGARIHIVDARAVCGAAHAGSALLHARRAHERGRGRARDLKVDVMMYLTGQRQISHAIERAGLRATSTRVVVMVEGDEKGARLAAERLLRALTLEREDGALAAGTAKLKGLGLRPTADDASDPEARALELVAMLDLE